MTQGFQSSNFSTEFSDNINCYFESNNYIVFIFKINFKFFIMIKNFLNLEGVQVLGKTQQITINGGGPNHETPECPPIDPTVPHIPSHDEEFCDV